MLANAATKKSKLQLTLASITPFFFFLTKTRTYNYGQFTHEPSVRGKLDVISLYLIIVGLSVFSLTSVGYAFGGRPIGIVGAILSLTGIVFWLMFLAIKPPQKQSQIVDSTFTAPEILISFMAAVATSTAIFMVNAAANQFFPDQSSATADPLTRSSVAQYMAIAEELFFRLGLQVNLMYLGGPVLGVPLGIGMNAVFGTIFHVYRYGAEPLFLIIVLFSWIVIGASFYFAQGRLVVTLLSHMIVNFVAAPPEGAFKLPQFSGLMLTGLVLVSVIVYCKRRSLKVDLS